MACLIDAHQILPGLWLGSLASVRRHDLLKKAGITHVITCLPYSDIAERNIEIPEGIQWMIIPVEDALEDTIFPHIEAVVNAVGNALHINEQPPIGVKNRILIHCFGGISRSPSLAAAYVMWRLRLRWAAAVAYVRERRPCVNPNGSFLKDLERFDRALFRDETLPTVPNKNR
jgi:protein-tyrosine phosphatase